MSGSWSTCKQIILIWGLTVVWDSAACLQQAAEFMLINSKKNESWTPDVSMVRNYVRSPRARNYRSYSEPDLLKAVRLVQSGQQSLRKTSAQYNIPLGTLINKQMQKEMFQSRRSQTKKRLCPVTGKMNKYSTRCTQIACWTVQLERHEHGWRCCCIVSSGPHSDMLNIHDRHKDASASTPQNTGNCCSPVKSYSELHCSQSFQQMHKYAFCITIWLRLGNTGLWWQQNRH